MSISHDTEAVSLVMLSVLEKPLSLAAIRSGAPGAPGTRVSTLKFNGLEDSTLSPVTGSEICELRLYEPSCSGPTLNW